MSHLDVVAMGGGQFPGFEDSPGATFVWPFGPRTTRERQAESMLLSGGGWCGETLPDAIRDACRQALVPSERSVELVRLPAGGGLGVVREIGLQDRGRTHSPSPNRAAIDHRLDAPDEWPRVKVRRLAVGCGDPPADRAWLERDADSP